MKGNIQKFITAISLVMMIAATTFAAIPVQAASEADLIIDGRETAADVGNVTVTNDTTNIYVTYTIDPDWSVVDKPRVYLGYDAPEKSSPGRFNCVAVQTADNEWTCTMAIADLPGTIDEPVVVYVAAHAALTQTITDADGNVIEVLEESGWAQAGVDADGNVLDTLIRLNKNWATYFEYTLGENPV